ncbi:MAG: sigma-54-dependent Fis family transcriptional regulator [Deltaproteobacteria bacterium]|nr:sigma-54-dependent Fis family transcriptional regulator [Deltaproteobacteria bacterium]
MALSILVVDDDKAFASSLCRFLEKEGHQVEHASTGEQGVQMFSKRSSELVILDLVLPGLSGLQALEQIKRADDAAPIIVMTGHGSIETAVQAMRLGAMDYLTKPIDLEALTLKLDTARQFMKMRSDLRYLLERERRGSGFGAMIGECPAVLEVYDKIQKVATTDNTTVLIIGESGTGKELVAGAIHSMSARSSKPLIQIDCTTIPINLLESELFGHEPGAFSGADRMKKGLFELAHEGTLLLDEIGDMDLAVQAKFLRVLEERKFRRVGGSRDLHFDTRVIAATNQDLDELAKQGKFRRELLYRLKVFKIDVPALRDRGSDILLVARAFIERYAHSFKKPVRDLDPEATAALLHYPFPGNIRELRNIIEQAVILARSELITRDLLPIPDPSTGRFDTGRPPTTALSIDALGPNPLEAAERLLIDEALLRSGGNKSRAAELLGITRFTLQRKMGKS